MTPQEFKSWFEGFTEAMAGAPNKEQWAKIKKRVAEIDGKTVTERVYVDRYIDRYVRPFWPQYPYWANGTIYSCQSGNADNLEYQNFNSLSAMNALGRAESMSVTQG